MFRKILAANDGSTNAFKALKMACALAAKIGAELHLIAIEEVPASHWGHRQRGLFRAGAGHAGRSHRPPGPLPGPDRQMRAPNGAGDASGVGLALAALSPC